MVLSLKKDLNRRILPVIKDQTLFAGYEEITVVNHEISSISLSVLLGTYGIHLHLYAGVSFYQMLPIWWMQPYTWYLWYCSGQTVVKGDTPEGTFLLHHAVLTDFSYLSHHPLDKSLLISDLYPWSFGTPNGEENPDLPESKNNPGQTIPSW